MNTTNQIYSNQRLLYLIQHTNNKMFKIGIATNNSRFKHIDSDYSIDWNKSLYFKGENEDIQYMEKILHRLFFKNRLEPQNGTGGTEWFSSDILEKVVDSIIFNVEQSEFNIKLLPYSIELNNEYDNYTDKNKSTVITDKNESISYYEWRKSVFAKYPKKIVDEWMKLEKSIDPFSDIKMNDLIPEFMVFNKPSELCQVMYFDDVKKGLFAYLSPTEIDLINLILYKSREEIIKNKTELSNANFNLELLLNDISKLFNKYSSTGYEPLIENFRNLRKKEIVINVLNKNKEMETTYTSLIHKIKISKHQSSKLKKITLELDNEIIGMMLNVKRLFSTMFFKIQFSLDSKYSKLLYEILRDYLGQNYNGIKSRVIDIDMLLGLLNIKNLKRYKQFSFFNGEILKKATKEINDKSDIRVSYEPIKERPNGERLQVTKIKFYMEKQSDTRLEELGLIEQEPELSIEEQIQHNNLESKSRTKANKLINNGYEIKDIDSWVKSDIKKYKSKYLDELRIDKWIDETDENDKKTVLEIIASDLDDPVIHLDNYLIKGLFSEELITKSPTETITLINDVLTNY